MHNTAKFIFRLCGVGALATTIHAAEIDFNRDIRPILSDKCYACHGPAEEKVKGGYRASDRENSIKTGVIVPGNPSKSILIERILSANVDEVMPPPESKRQLSAREKASSESHTPRFGRAPCHGSVRDTHPGKHAWHGLRGTGVRRRSGARNF